MTQTKAEKIQARDFIPKSTTEAGRRILANAPPTYAFTNGKWFGGWTFVEKTMYSEGGAFRSHRPAKIDETIDLSGKYVIPRWATLTFTGSGSSSSRTRTVDRPGRSPVRRF